MVGQGDDGNTSGDLQGGEKNSSIHDEHRSLMFHGVLRKIQQFGKPSLFGAYRPGLAR
jgi:hypothetical protein